MNLEIKKTKYTIINNYLVFFLTIFLFIAFSSVNSSLLHQLFKIPFLSRSLSIILAVILTGMLFMLNKSKTFNLTIFFLVMVSLGITSVIGLNLGVPFPFQLIEMFFVIGIFYSCMNLDASPKVVSITLITLGFFEGLLGLVQFLLKNPIFQQSNVTSESLYKSVFYSSGSSANVASALTGNVRVRAFGSFQSGLELGLFCLLCLAILLSSRLKKRLRSPIIVFFVVVIICTITRNIYIATVLFFLIYILKKWIVKNLKRLKIAYLIIMLLMAFAPSIHAITGILNAIAGAFSISTFGDRFSFLSIGMGEIPSLKALLFGSNITATDNLPIDNSFIASLLKNGLVFAIIQNFFMYKVFSEAVKHVKTENISLLILMFLYPIIGFSNNVTFNFMVIYVLCLALIKNNVNY